MDRRLWNTRGDVCFFRFNISTLYIGPWASGGGARGVHAPLDLGVRKMYRSFMASIDCLLFVLSRSSIFVN